MRFGVPNKCLKVHLCRTKLPRKVLYFNTKSETKKRTPRNVPEIFKPCSAAEKFFTGTFSLFCTRNLKHNFKCNFNFFCTTRICRHDHAEKFLSDPLGRDWRCYLCDALPLARYPPECSFSSCCTYSNGTRERVQWGILGGEKHRAIGQHIAKLGPSSLGKRNHTPPWSSAELCFAEKKGSAEERFWWWIWFSWFFIGFLYPPLAWKVFL